MFLSSLFQDHHMSSYLHIHFLTTLFCTPSLYYSVHTSVATISLPKPSSHSTPSNISNIFHRTVFVNLECEHQHASAYDTEMVEGTFYNSLQPHPSIQPSHWLRAVVNPKHFTPVQNLGYLS